MKARRLISDQLNTWSDIYAKENIFFLAETPAIAFTATAASGGDPTWLAYRALQAMWQARMQVRQWSGTRSQVLSFGELPWLSPANGLRAARLLRPDHGIPRQLPTNPRDFARDLRDQLRATAAPRGALKSGGGRCIIVAHRTIRDDISRRAAGQYARSLARRQAQRHGSDEGIQ
jgi:hypothetical protein